MTKTVKINNIEYKMKIEMVDDRDFALVTLEELGERDFKDYIDEFVWYYHDETLNRLIEEIKKDLHI